MTKALAMKQNHHHDPEELRRAGYRRLRATSVLAKSSVTLKRMQTPEYHEVLEELVEVNYDMDRMKNDRIEILFEMFDENMTQKVIDEFTFMPTMGSIRDLGRCEGICSLCGKGDSRDDGLNEDKIRYQFRLTNTVGGDDIWVGSTCILQHGLHVEGARTAEEAERILRKTLQQHLKRWKIERWRASNPLHVKIPEHWQALRRNHPEQLATRNEWEALGIDFVALRSEWYRLVSGRGKQTFRTASRFYARKGFLTEQKEGLWKRARAVLKTMKVCAPLLLRAQEMYPRRWGPAGDEAKAKRLDWLNAQASKVAKKKRRRTPRKL